MFSVDNYIGSIKLNLEKQSDLLVGNLGGIPVIRLNSIAVAGHPFLL